jgi:hypothetical protein
MMPRSMMMMVMMVLSQNRVGGWLSPYPPFENERERERRPLSSIPALRYYFVHGKPPLGLRLGGWGVKGGPIRGERTCFAHVTNLATGITKGHPSIFHPSSCEQPTAHTAQDRMSEEEPRTEWFGRPTFPPLKFTGTLGPIKRAYIEARWLRLGAWKCPNQTKWKP